MSECISKAGIIEPEYWTMRPIVCQYCNRAAQWDSTENGEDNMDEFYEEMGVDSHVHGWVYCINCKSKHKENRNRYLTKEGYVTASQFFRDHPALRTLDDKMEVGIRVAKSFDHCVVYHAEKSGWEIQKAYPYKYCCFKRHGKIWIRLVNASIGSYACSHLSEILKVNRIPHERVGVLRKAIQSSIQERLTDRSTRLILMFAYSNRVDGYLVQVGL